jgi:hypothetical protein
VAAARPLLQAAQARTPSRQAGPLQKSKSKKKAVAKSLEITKSILHP